ncbi:hypothetical protein F5X68DRAFT_2575 [Plectosphaerella plurivora]|uniref:Uncharacterized protein n=1 Tax=Plectosphaerella plurivora TaxID=936078 RepID=A0A9P8VM79_9PEZI|nr:hypothetical protein F5X68DRAFT_2575 [Plectosphaerella plurivora]
MCDTTCGWLTQPRARARERGRAGGRWLVVWLCASLGAPWVVKSEFTLGRVPRSGRPSVVRWDFLAARPAVPVLGVVVTTLWRCTGSSVGRRSRRRRGG